MSQGFVRYELRTTDVDSARAFYVAALGPDFWADGLSVTALPIQAAQRGAPAHWLGHLRVDDVAPTAERIVALGGAQLGPMRDSGVVMRDPFGAILALTSQTPAERERVAWHVLHSPDEARSFAAYSALFGWAALDRLDLGAEGVHQHFAWRAGQPVAGSIANTVRLPVVHPHWLYFFEVPDLDATRARVIELGGTAMALKTTSRGDLVVGCEDQQRAAFGLLQRG